MMHPLDEANVDPAVYPLLRQLVTRLVERHPLAAPDRPAGAADVEQLLDVEVDGVWCWFVRIAPPRVPPRALSPREQEIARMVAKGHTNQAIADVLGISAWTVSTHLRRIFAKLGVNSRAAMVAGVLTNERWREEQPRPASRLRVTPVHATPVRGS